MTERKIIDVDRTAPLISSKKKNQGKITLLVLIGATLAIVFSILFFTGSKVQKIGDYTVATVDSGTITSSTDASGTVVLPTQVSIVSTSEGYADILNISVGDKITTETILAQLEVPDLELERVDYENTIESKEIALEQVELNNYFTIKELETSIERKKRDIEEAKEELKKAESLKELKSSRESDYETAIENLTNLEEELFDLELKLEKEGRSGELNVKSQETQIKQAKLGLDRVLEAIEDANIKSPIAGEVLSIDSKLSVPGSLITQNSELFSVADTENVVIDLEVYEQYKNSLKLGDIIDVLISSTTIKAEIIQIGSIASLSTDSLAATIEIRVKPVEDISLTMGASAVANIPLGKIENALTLPRGSYLTTGNQKYLYVVRDGIAIKTKVTFGSMEGNKVQILTGVEEGDKVIISSYQNFIDQDQIELKEK